MSESYSIKHGGYAALDQILEFIKTGNSPRPNLALRDCSPPRRLRPSAGGGNAPMSARNSSIDAAEQLLGALKSA